MTQEPTVFYIYQDDSSLWALIACLHFALSAESVCNKIKQSCDMFWSWRRSWQAQGHLLQLKFSFWHRVISSVPVLLSAIVHNNMDYSFLSEWRREACKKEKGELGQICTRHRALWLEDCKETGGLWPLRFPPGLHDGVRASLGANHADRFWAAPRSAV